MWASISYISLLSATIAAVSAANLSTASSAIVAKLASDVASKISSIASESSNENVSKRSEFYDAAISLQVQKNQDPYVKSSPLSVAAVCSDGLAMVTLHYGVDDDCIEDNESEEKLKIADNSEETLAINERNDDLIAKIEGNDDSRSQLQSSKDRWMRAFRDLPMSTRGPLRIEQVYHHGAPISRQMNGISKPLPPPMAILTAGWRTDGMTLASAARDLIAEERMLYCLPHLAMSDERSTDVSIASDNESKRKYITENTGCKKKDTISKRIETMRPYYGRRIAEGLSYYLAKCDFSESARSLSTVGMLAVGSNNVNGVGSIYLIDATGSYRVRAHAIGAGAAVLNRRMGRIDFGGMNCREGLKVLLRLIAEEGGLSHDGFASEDNKATSNIKSDKAVSAVQQDINIASKNKNSELRLWNLSENIAVELAAIRSSEGMMNRVRISALMS
jgi:hypothetical protein